MQKDALADVKSGRRESFLRCLASVQAQTGIRLEHVIVDGGSTDGTVELVSKVKCVHSQVVISEPDAGIYDAMNKGIRRARGKYVVFINSDDYYHDADGLRRSVAELERTGADFSYAPAVVIGELGSFAVSHPHVAPNPDHIFTQMEFSHQSMVVRRSVFERLGAFDLDYKSSSDYDFLLRMIFAGCRGCYVPVPFVTFALGGYSCANLDMANREVARIYVKHYVRQTGMDVSEDEALRFYIDKTLTPELDAILSPFGERTFGHDERWGQLDYFKAIPDRVKNPVLDFRLSLLPVKSGKPGVNRPLALLSCALRHPLCSVVYVVLYLRARKLVPKHRVKRAAYDELVARFCGPYIR